MKRQRAVFTMVYNEAVFLPLWLRYYSRYFAPEDIYVLDHASTDDSTKGTGFVLVTLPDSSVDAELQRDYVQGRQNELIDQYDVVLYTDVDEFIIPDPESGCDLGGYIDKFTSEYVNCNGYEILHVKDEAPLDLSRNIMVQRSQWFPNDDYLSKPLLARIPMKWDVGCHTTPRGKNQDPALYLIHLHRADYGICLERHHKINVRPRCAQDIKNGWSDQRHIVDPVHFESWFYGNYALNVQPIPERWKSVTV